MPSLPGCKVPWIHALGVWRGLWEPGRLRGAECCQPLQEDILTPLLEISKHLLALLDSLCLLPFSLV